MSNDADDDNKSETENSLVKGDFQFTDIFGISKFGKLGNTIATRFFDGIGCAYDDRLAKKHADDKAYEIEVVGKAKANIETYYQEQSRTLEGRASIRVTHQQTRQQENLEAIAKHAIEYTPQIEEQGPNSDHTEEPEWGPKNDDWMAEFLDLSKNTSEEHMRELWGRVLAHEVKKPGSFSVQALMTMKTMSPAAAHIFEKICALNVKPLGLIKTDKEAFLTKVSYELSYTEIMIARENRLLTVGDSTVHNMSSQDDLFLTYFNHRQLLANDTSKMISTHVIPLTEIGKELSSIPAVERNDAYFVDFENYLQQLGFTFIPIKTINPTDK